MELYLSIGISLMLIVIFTAAYFQIKQNRKNINATNDTSEKATGGIKINLNKSWKEASVVSLIAGIYQTVSMLPLILSTPKILLVQLIFLANVLIGLGFIVLSFYIKKLNKTALISGIILSLIWIADSVYSMIASHNIILLVWVIIKFIVLYFLIQPTSWHKRKLEEYQRILKEKQ